MVKIKPIRWQSETNAYSPVLGFWIVHRKKDGTFTVSPPGGGSGVFGPFNAIEQAHECVESDYRRLVLELLENDNA